MYSPRERGGKSDERKGIAENVFPTHFSLPLLFNKFLGSLVYFISLPPTHDNGIVVTYLCIASMTDSFAFSLPLSLVISLSWVCESSHLHFIYDSDHC